MEHISQYLKAGEVRATPVIRKIGSGGWYWIDKNVMKVYAKSLGPSAIVVYNVLALFSNSKTQSCYPTHRTIGRIAGMSKRTVSQKMRQLESSGLIRREWQKGQSICYLLDIQEAVNHTLSDEITDPGG